MRLNNLLFALSITLIWGCTQKTEINTDNSFTLVTSDSLKIYGDAQIIDPQATTILLFHQGGSNARGEYESITPRLKSEGYNVVAIDQRVGGQIYGDYNRTVADLEINPYSFCDAYPDLESTLNYITANNMVEGKIIVWGSSYSGTLAIQLAAKNQEEIAAVLAFSPASGGPMAACRPDEYFEGLEIPLLLLRPAGEMEIESVQAQFKLAQDANHETYVAENGVHGSSMLVTSRVEGSTDAHWERVIEFISESVNR